MAILTSARPVFMVHILLLMVISTFGSSNMTEEVRLGLVNFNRQRQLLDVNRARMMQHERHSMPYKKQTNMRHSRPIGKISQAHEVVFEILRSKNHGQGQVTMDKALPETESAHKFVQDIKSDPSFVSALIVSDPRLLASFYLAKHALDYPGDFVETGVYRGCTAAIMMKVLMTLDDKGRKF